MPAVDDNGAPLMYGVSHRDGRTPVQIKFTADGKMAVDRNTTIEFDPSVNAFQNNDDRPFAKATSSSDDSTVRPWVVNEDTGAVLIAG